VIELFRDERFLALDLPSCADGNPIQALLPIDVNNILRRNLNPPSEISGDQLHQLHQTINCEASGSSLLFEVCAERLLGETAPPHLIEEIRNHPGFLCNSYGPFRSRFCIEAVLEMPCTEKRIKVIEALLSPRTQRMRKIVTIRPEFADSGFALHGSTMAGEGFSVLEGPLVSWTDILESTVRGAICACLGCCSNEVALVMEDVTLEYRGHACDLGQRTLGDALHEAKVHARTGLDFDVKPICIVLAVKNTYPESILQKLRQSTKDGDYPRRVRQRLL